MALVTRMNQDSIVTRAALFIGVLCVALVVLFFLGPHRVGVAGSISGDVEFVYLIRDNETKEPIADALVILKYDDPERRATHPGFELKTDHRGRVVHFEKGLSGSFSSWHFVNDFGMTFGERTQNAHFSPPTGIFAISFHKGGRRQFHFAPETTLSYRGQDPVTSIHRMEVRCDIEKK